MYHFEFDIAAVCITLFIGYYIIVKKGVRRHANRVYLGMLIFNFLAEISDIFGSIANNNPQFTTTAIQDFWNYLYLSSHNIMGYIFMMYVFYMIGYEKSKRTPMLVIGIPVLVELVLLCSLLLWS